MGIHSNAKLTVAQRKEVKRMYHQEKVPVKKLMQIYQVSEQTIRKWLKRDSPQDKSSRPNKVHRVITAPYKQAVLSYRRQYPSHGPIRIAYELKNTYSFAHRGTVLCILQEAKLTKAKAKKPLTHLPVGRHRVQMDIQQLPAVEGGSGFEYKISMIHLATRFKYSEIHADSTTESIAGVFRRGLDALPPFLASGQTMP